MQNPTTNNQVKPSKSKKSKIISWLISIAAFIGFIAILNIIFPIIFGSISLNKKVQEYNETKSASESPRQTDNVKFNFEDIDSNQYSEQRLAECFIDLGIISSSDQLNVLPEEWKQKNWQDCLILQKKKQEMELDVYNSPQNLDSMLR